MKREGFICFLVCVFLMLFNTWSFAGVQSVPLTVEDCGKCHDKIAKDVNERGALHKEDVSCLDCHLEHPPAGKDTIPTCDMCHDPGDSAHYAIKDCIICHYPHYPTEIDLSKIDNVKPTCLSCHPDQGQEMQAHPSEHAGLDCKECHSEHGESTPCMECHESHAEGMNLQACLSCHKPHGPTEVKYDDSVPVDYCTCCHENEGSNLAKSSKAHHELGCVECHESEHKAATPCESCHDAKPHGTFMHEKYPNCVDCHRDPHALAE